MPGVELNHFITMLLNMNKQKLGKKKKKLLMLITLKQQQIKNYL